MMDFNPRKGKLIISAIPIVLSLVNLAYSSLSIPESISLMLVAPWLVFQVIYSTLAIPFISIINALPFHEAANPFGIGVKAAIIVGFIYSIILYLLLSLFSRKKSLT